jgi:hypothetical protein
MDSLRIDVDEPRLTLENEDGKRIYLYAVKVGEDDVLCLAPSDTEAEEQVGGAEAVRIPLRIRGWSDREVR